MAAPSGRSPALLTPTAPSRPTGRRRLPHRTGSPARSRSSAVIWTSPALRARQTAEAVVAAIGERPVTPLPSLFEQDEEAFLDALRASDAPCVIAVGHIPFMERVAERLCGAELSFSPGAVACIRLDFCPDPFASDLLWFVQGPNT